MKKEELFNIIGEVDEQKVAAAGMAMNTERLCRRLYDKEARRNGRSAARRQI